MIRHIDTSYKLCYKTRRHFRFQSNAERLLADSTGNIVNKFEHDGGGRGVVGREALYRKGCALCMRVTAQGPCAEGAEIGELY